MTSIRTTVEQGMRSNGAGQYLAQAEPVIRLLEQRERQAIQTLTSLATQRGISQQECQYALQQAGLDTEQSNVRPMQSYSTPSDSQQGAQFGNEPQQFGSNQRGDVAQQISDLQNQVRSLQDAARRAGVQV